MNANAHPSKRGVELPASVALDVPAGHVVVVLEVGVDGRPTGAAPAVFVPAGPGEQELLLSPPAPVRVDVHVVPAAVEPPRDGLGRGGAPPPVN